MIQLFRTLLVLLLASTAAAEQKIGLPGLDIHYIVLSTMDLSPDAAARYDIPRGPRRGFINISVVENEPPATSVSVQAKAEVKNLLGQVETVILREISEPPARYSVGTFSFSPDETMRFRFVVTLPDGQEHSFEHTQQMFVEE